jgi:hypothetical protein
MTTKISPAQGAAWLQQRIDHDDTAFRRRAGAGEALKRLRAATVALVHRVGGDRVDLLLGRRIGGVAIQSPRDSASAQTFVDAFYREHWALFGSAPPADGAVRVQRFRPGSPTVAEVQQHIDGIPVADARWTLLFDRAGYLTQVTGAPARITVSRRPAITAEEAVGLALGHAGLTREEVDVTTSLVLEGRTDRLVWTVEFEGTRRAALFGAAEVDAHARTVVARHDRCEHGVVAIPVRHYSHPGGIKDSSGVTSTSSINVDSVEIDPPKPGLPSVELFSLQRLGSGRSRIWNANGDGSAPVFSRTISDQQGYFTKIPGATPTKVFNEQQTYVWAQTLKTDVDEWGREPNAYGHYPVDAARAINVEIVVNGDAGMEDDWSSDGNGSVMHGYFRSSTPRGWFSGHPSAAATVPAVFLFNSDGNSASPQLFGPERSSSYSIVAHEVGHFISWQYGGWSGASGTKLASSLNEGHSMVVASLLGKQEFSALEYDESEYVATGSKIDGAQWSHHVIGQPTLRHSAMDCVNDDAYYIAWPYVQAMWRLMNNVGPDGDPIIEDGTEQDPLPNTYCDVFSVFSQHALLTRCVNSP